MGHAQINVRTWACSRTFILEWTTSLDTSSRTLFVREDLLRNNVERGSSVVECRTRNQVSPGSNPALLPCRRLGIFVLSIDAPVDSAV